MSALEQLNETIKNVRDSCKKFSTVNLIDIPDEKLGVGIFTVAEAIHTFEDLLQSVEVSMKNPNEVAKYITHSEITNVINSINALSSTFSSKDYSSFVSTLDSQVIYFRPFAMLSMEKMDSKRYKDIADIGKTLQEIKMQAATIKTIFNATSQRDEKIEKILSANNQRATEMDAALPTAQNNIAEIQNLLENAVGKNSEITTAAEEAQQTKGQLTVYESQAENKSNELEEMLKQGEISLKEQTKTAKEMISSAEKALHLSAAEGLSAAFSAKARDLGSLRTKRWWLSFGIASSIIASGIGWYTILFSSEWYIVLPRFVLMGIFLGLSAFAFRQYSKNKSLEYDYAFKSALVGSYPGIAAQFVDEETRKEYASKLIIEILQDPQRTRARKITTPASGIGKQHG